MPYFSKEKKKQTNKHHVTADAAAPSHEAKRVNDSQPKPSYLRQAASRSDRTNPEGQNKTGRGITITFFLQQKKGVETNRVRNGNGDPKL